MMPFAQITSHGYLRIAAFTGPVSPAVPHANAHTVIRAAHRAEKEGISILAFPELNLTGYSIDDLFLTDTLLDSAEEAVAHIVQESNLVRTVMIVGVPVCVDNAVYNCALVIGHGKIYGCVPKSYLPTYREFYEERYFQPAHSAPASIDFFAGQEDIPCGADLLFSHASVTFHVEICEDMWVPISPASQAALSGGELLINISGSPITVGRARSRSALVEAASIKNVAACLYTAAGVGESSTDLSWDGQAMIYEMGEELAKSERFAQGEHFIIADIDVQAIRHARRQMGTFHDNARELELSARVITLEIPSLPLSESARHALVELRRPLERFPFVPSDKAQLDHDCYEAYNIQVHGLVQRLRAIGNPKLVIGVSGGLDSTHALIVAARAMDELQRPRTDILAYTLPGFATSAHTRTNAEDLCENLGVSFQTIDIRPMAQTMLEALGHSAATGEENYDVTYENVQAGLRTDILFRLANQHKGIVLGTGDLSELALGWCTFGVGDQMSHYNVNAGVPKTLIQHLIRWVIAQGEFGEAVSHTLQSILDTEISPELVPAKDGAHIQSTQEKIGPYELQDFTLYHFLAQGKGPWDIAYLAWNAWKNVENGNWPSGFPASERHEYSLVEIKKWMELFFRRFFANQFKRSTLPNGPKVSSGGTLSPRGDWRMPSDVSSKEWIEELSLVPEEPFDSFYVAKMLRRNE